MQNSHPILREVKMPHIQHVKGRLKLCRESHSFSQKVQGEDCLCLGARGKYFKHDDMFWFWFDCYSCLIDIETIGRFSLLSMGTHPMCILQDTLHCNGKRYYAAPLLIRRQATLFLIFHGAQHHIHWIATTAQLMQPLPLSPISNSFLSQAGVASHIQMNNTNK